MVFCHEWVQAGDGEICAIELASDLKRAQGEPRLLFRASDAPWRKEMHHSSGVGGCVTDGPFLWRTADGTPLCLWASLSHGGYTEGAAVSDNGELYLTLHSPNTHLQERP